MAFRIGSLSARRYRVIGEVSAEMPQLATTAFRRHTFKAINDEKAEREAFGWVNPRNVLHERFTYEDVKAGPCVFIGVRRDRKSFSKVLFRARMEAKMDGVRKARKIERITRQHRLSLEEEVSVEMLKETSPTSSFYEFVWDPARGEAYIGTTGGAMCERIKDLFEVTFDLQLVPWHPALVGRDRIAEQGLEKEFALTISGLRSEVSDRENDASET